MARALGTTAGELSLALRPRQRDAATTRLRRALPGVDAAHCRSLVRQSFRNQSRLRYELPGTLRLDPTELCRRLSLEGWNHLAEAERGDRPALILSAPLGAWEVAAVAVAIYRGRLDVVPPAGGPGARRAPSSRLDDRREALELRPHRTEAELAGSFETGRRLLVVAQPPDAGEPSVSMETVAELSIARGAPIVPLFCIPQPAGGYRVICRPALESPGEVEEIARRCRSALAAEIGRHPSWWPWSFEPWSES